MKNLKVILGIATVAAGTVIYFLSETTTYYASPIGAGNGKSKETPCSISSFWSVAQPGFTLYLLDGEYFVNIVPPENLKGESGKPITIKALRDGKVTINGESKRIPIKLSHNDYFIIEGVNVCNSSGSVVSMEYSSHNIVRRVCAWDAYHNNVYDDSNHHVFQLAHSSEYNLIEDCAGWGKGRKIYECFKASNNIFRRCWGRWEHSDRMGACMTFSMGYFSWNLLFENCIGTWGLNDAMVAHNPSTEDHSSIGIFSLDRLVDGDVPEYSRWNLIHAYSQLLGSLAYIKSDDIYTATQMIYIRFVENWDIKDVIAYYPLNYPQVSAAYPNRPFLLMDHPHLPPQPLWHNPWRYATGITAIGGQENYFYEWDVSNKVEVANASQLNSDQNIFTGSTGAKLCYRYINSVLTNEKLWPWPMNERIKAARVQSGRAEVDVTATVKALFGDIPTDCIAEGSE